MNVEQSLQNYAFDARLALDSDQSATDYQVMQTPGLVDALIEESDLAQGEFSDQQVDRLVDFLLALTDMRVQTDRSEIPFRVPSGLAVAD